jgi:hypothetical protein
VQDLTPGSKPVALTAADSKQRFANYVLDEPRNRLLAVCEDHSKGDDQEASNSIAAIGEFICCAAQQRGCSHMHLQCVHQADGLASCLSMT